MPPTVLASAPVRTELNFTATIAGVSSTTPKEQPSVILSPLTVGESLSPLQGTSNQQTNA